MEVVLELVVVMVGQMKSRGLFELLLGLLKVVGVRNDLERKMFIGLR
jgi:hypothetical protein